MKRLNKQTIPQRSFTEKAAAISFRKTGEIGFNKAALKTLSLKDGDYVEFTTDEIDGKLTLYVTKSNDKQGFQVRSKYNRNSKQPVLCFSHRLLKQTIFTELGISELRAQFKLKPEPIKQPGFGMPLYQLDTTIDS